MYKQLGFAFLAVVTSASWVWLWLMISRPDRWEALVEKENTFWVSKGIVSASTAEKFKRFELGYGQKLVTGGAAILGTLAFIYFAFKA